MCRRCGAACRGSGPTRGAAGGKTTVEIVRGRGRGEGAGLDDGGGGQHVRVLNGVDVFVGAAGQHQRIGACERVVERAEQCRPVIGVEFVETVDHRQHHAVVDELTGHGPVDRTQRRVVLAESEGQPVLQPRMGRGVPAVRRQQHRNRLRRCADFEESQK